MKLTKKWMSVAVALGLFAGASEGHAVRTFKDTVTDKIYNEMGVKISDDDFAFLKDRDMKKEIMPLMEKWKEAKAAGMSHADIRAVVGTNRNQAAIDALTAGIAAHKNPGGRGASSSSSSSSTTATSSSSSSSSSSLLSSSSSLNSSSSSSSTYTDKDVDDAFQKILKLQMDGSLKKDFAAYVMSVAKTRDAMEKLLKEMKTYMDDPLLQLSPEHYVELMKNKVRMEDFRELRLYGYFYPEIYSNARKGTLNTLLEQGRNGKGIGNASSISSSSSSSSSSSAAKSSPISKEFNEQTMKEAIGLMTINSSQLNWDFAQINKWRKAEMFHMQDLQNLLARMRKELDDARAAGFTDQQLNYLFGQAFVYSNWRAYLKIPGKTPAKLYDAIQNQGKTAAGDRARALAFFGLDEEKATIPEGIQAASEYGSLKGYVGFTGDRYWKERRVLLSRLMADAFRRYQPSASSSDEFTFKTMQEVLGLPGLSKNSNFTQEVSTLGKQPVSEREAILKRMRKELDDARAAGFTDAQLTELWDHGFVYSNWRTYIKLPGKNPSKFTDVVVRGNLFDRSLAWLGLDEEKATNQQGQVSAQKIFSGIPENYGYWDAQLKVWAKNILADMPLDKPRQASQPSPSSPQSAPNSPVRSEDANQVTVVEVTKAGEIMLALTKSLGHNPTTPEILKELKTKMKIDDKKAHAILEAMDIE